MGWPEAFAFVGASVAWVLLLAWIIRRFTRDGR